MTPEHIHLVTTSVLGGNSSQPMNLSPGLNYGKEGVTAESVV